MSRQKTTHFSLMDYDDFLSLKELEGQKIVEVREILKDHRSIDFEIVTEDERFTDITVVCRSCEKPHTVTVIPEHFALWGTIEDGVPRANPRGSLIQVAMPELSADDRELLISGTCGPCFDKMFE